MSDWVDPAEIAPGVVKVLLDNDKVRVMDVRSKPGDKVPMHDHPTVIAYVLEDSQDRWIFPDGSVQDHDLKAGQVLYAEPFRHAEEPRGDFGVHLLVVELKA
jgi:beta-alanine degradation protein BauB